MKHWTELLPEAGTIARMGQSQLCKQEKIAIQKAMLAEMEKDYQREEDRLLKLAKDNWEAVEIIEAKHKAKEHVEAETLRAKK